MNQASKYYDKRAEFFKSYFQKGSDFQSYVQSGNSSQLAKWENFYQQISLSSTQRSMLEQFTRKMNVLVLSGIWCGDCARQGPMIRRIEEASSVISVKFIDNRANPELQDELRIIGASRVPVIVVFSEDFFELARFGDRTLSVYRRKALTELGPACDAGITPLTDDELNQELGEWVNFFERLQLLLRLAPGLRERYQD